MTDAQDPIPPPPPSAGWPGVGPPPAPPSAPWPAVPPPPRPPTLNRPRAGQLTTAWQIMVAVTWAAAFFAFAGVWKASAEIGIATWWLGPRADMQPMVVRVLPFVIVLAVAMSAVYNVRVVPWISLGGTVAVAAIAAADWSNSTGLAIAELTIAGAVGLVTLASFGGRYRRPAGGAVGEATADEGDAPAPEVAPERPPQPSPAEPSTAR